jgi:hypothetical protein
MAGEKGDVLDTLLRAGGVTRSVFMNEYWEKEHLHCRSEHGRKVSLFPSP